MSLDPKELRAPFEAAYKPAPAWGVGIEHEKHAFRRDDLSPVPYEGPGGIRRVLELMVERHGYQPTWDSPREDSPIIAARCGKSSVTLEPGGQIEWSGSPLQTVHEACGEEARHLTVLRDIGEELGIFWISLGFNPLHAIGDMRWMPKRRYEIMRGYLPTRGSLALEMMLLTGTVQANLDFSDAEDLGTKARVATLVSPLVSALYANSPLRHRQASGFESWRCHVWQNMDPDRSGIPDFLVDPAVPEAEVLDHYIEWALDAPLFFIKREGQLLETHQRFRDFCDAGFEGHQATPDDWNLHLSTLFPEVRLKNTLELRGADSCPREGVCALAALWKGLLYDPTSRTEARQLMGAQDAAALRALLEDVSRRGLQAESDGRPVLELARSLVEISRAGLKRIHDVGRRGYDETGYLEPLEQTLEEGRSPGARVLARWEGEWKHDPRRLAQALQYH